MEVEYDFPVSEYMKEKIFGGITIYKSNRSWLGILKTKDGRIRLYKWIKRGDQWKVDLARFDITDIWKKISEAIEFLNSIPVKTKE